MVKRKSPLALFFLLMVGVLPARGDTLYQTNPQGRQVVVHRDAIVVKDDPSFILYKHFDLKERRVAKIRLSRGAADFSIATSRPEERQQIVAKWKRFGFTATLVDQAGKSVRIFDLYLDFYPPGGRGSLLESVPPRTTLPVLIEGGGADELDFEKLARIEIQGETMRVTLRDGKALTARFLMPTDQPAEARVLGISDQYDPASENVFDFAIPLQQLKEIRFE